MRRRFTGMDEYISSYPNSIAEILQQMRLAIRKAAPKAGGDRLQHSHVQPRRLHSLLRSLQGSHLVVSYDVRHTGV